MFLLASLRLLVEQLVKAAPIGSNTRRVLVLSTLAHVSALFTESDLSIYLLEVDLFVVEEADPFLIAHLRLLQVRKVAPFYRFFVDRVNAPSLVTDHRRVGGASIHGVTRMEIWRHSLRIHLTRMSNSLYLMKVEDIADLGHDVRVVI